MLWNKCTDWLRDLDMLHRKRSVNAYFTEQVLLIHTILRERAYSAIGACVESGVKMITASPGESASIAALSSGLMSAFPKEIVFTKRGDDEQASGSALSSSG